MGTDWPAIVVQIELRSHGDQIHDLGTIDRALYGVIAAGTSAQRSDWLADARGRAQRLVTAVTTAEE